MTKVFSVEAIWILYCYYITKFNCTIAKFEAIFVEDTTKKFIDIISIKLLWPKTSIFWLYLIHLATFKNGIFLYL